MDSQDPSFRPQQPVVQAEVVHDRPYAPRRRSRFWGSLFLVLLVLALGGSLFLNVILFGLANLGSESDGRAVEKYHSYHRQGHQKVAIISVEGTIIEGDGGFVQHQVDRVLHDDNVKAVVLRVNSPGGTVTASDYLYHYLGKLTKEAKLPVVVSMGGLATSGGYYVSMAAGDQPDVIFAEPATWTGSIGVIIPHYDLAGLLQNWGVKEDSIASHRLKTMGSFTKPMTKEERDIWQGLVDESFARFKEIVKSGRPKFRKDPQALDRLATGQVFAAEQAKRDGLIDEIGFLDDAIKRAIQLARLNEDDVQVVKYKRESSLAGLLWGSEARSAIDLSALLQLAAPQAYYLSTWLPPMVASKGREN